MCTSSINLTLNLNQASPVHASVHQVQGLTVQNYPHSRVHYGALWLRLGKLSQS